MVKKIWVMVVSVVVLLAVAVLAGCSAGGTTGTGSSNLKVSVGNQQEGIWVNGSGKVSVVPDVATLQLGIESQEKSVANAQTNAATAMEKVIAALKDRGVATKDIQTRYYNIQRVTRWDNATQQEVLIGYRVTNLVTAKVRAMDKIGAIVDAVATAGGDLTRIDSIAFSMEDPTAYYKDARARAMADAQAKAKQLAELTGVKLGKPTYISESTYTPPVVYRQAAAPVPAPMPAAETPISPGELDIVLNVQVTYAIME